MLSCRVPLSPNLHVFNNQKSSEPCPFEVLWRLHYIAVIDQVTGSWGCLSISSPSPLLGDQGSGTESSNPLVAGLALGAACPHSWVFSKSHCINITKDIFIALITGNSEGFRSSVPKIRLNIKCIFLIINHNITTSHNYALINYGNIDTLTIITY